mmetsp:Transcript_85230/g.264802  ORF Transcript_85230/g.264802 Transcript_85230/m.264802 type:complete len:388 (+) Transcript_85230:177-1340(+)
MGGGATVACRCSGGGTAASVDCHASPPSLGRTTVVAPGNGSPPGLSGMIAGSCAWAACTAGSPCITGLLEKVPRLRGPWCTACWGNGARTTERSRPGGATGAARCCGRPCPLGGTARVAGRNGRAAVDSPAAAGNRWPCNGKAPLGAGVFVPRLPARAGTRLNTCASPCKQLMSPLVGLPPSSTPPPAATLLATPLLATPPVIALPLAVVPPLPACPTGAVPAVPATVPAMPAPPPDSNAARAWMAALVLALPSSASDGGCCSMKAATLAGGCGAVAFPSTSVSFRWMCPLALATAAGSPAKRTTLYPCAFVSWLRTSVAPLDCLICRNDSPLRPITQPTSGCGIIISLAVPGAMFCRFASFACSSLFSMCALAASTPGPAMIRTIL